VSLLAPIKLVNLEISREHLFSQIKDSYPSAYYAFWNASDYYGPDYLKDYALTTKYSDAGLIGKGNYIVYHGNSAREINADKSYTWVDQVPLATLMIKSDGLDSIIPEMIKDPNGFYKAESPVILSTDPLNFVKNEDGNLKLDQESAGPFIG